MYYLKRTISIKEIESIINNLAKEEPSGLDGFISDFYQEFKEEFISSHYNLFQKLKAEGILPNSFYKVSISILWIFQEKKTCRPISLTSTNAKIGKKNISKSNPTKYIMNFYP